MDLPALNDADTDYNGLMNLKLHLLIRMTLTALLCWLGVSFYLVGQSGRRAGEELVTIADQLQPIVTADVLRRWVSLDLDKRYPDLGGAAARFPDPLCLRYDAQDGSNSDWGCSKPAITREVPQFVARGLAAIGPGHLSLSREIKVFGLSVGTLRVEPDDASLMQRQWLSIRELLTLTAVTMLVLDLLASWVVGRALRPTARIVAAVEQLGEGRHDVRLPIFRPREFGLIANGINRLVERLARSDKMRLDLTARLITLQEDERRELMHELHEEFGQCVSALGAVSAGLRQSVTAGEKLTEADVLPLEVGVEQTLSSLRGLLQRMSQRPLEGQGLRSALADLITGWQIRLRNGPRIVLDAEGVAEGLSDNVFALCVYRVVQECLTNIARHAPTCHEVSVQIRQTPRSLCVLVSNDVQAVHASPTAPSSGMGLKLLGERVRALRGSLSFEMSASLFLVRAELPLGAR
jgi:two-component system, NarL family, sensor histidine kinase UhpB